MRNVQGRCEDTAGVRDFGTSERACALTGVVHNATMVDREDVVQNTGDEARSAMIDLEGVVQNASDVAVCAREIAQRERERERDGGSTADSARLHVQLPRRGGYGPPRTVYIRIPGACGGRTCDDRIRVLRHMRQTCGLL